MNLERPVLFYFMDSAGFDVPGNNAGESAAQIGRQRVTCLVLVQVERTHRFVRRPETTLKIGIDVQQPVEVVGIAPTLAEIAHRFEPILDFARHLLRVIDHNPVEALGLDTERFADEPVDAPEVLLGALRPGKNHGERQLGIVGMHQNTQQIEDFLCGPGAAGKDDDAVADADKGLKSLLDIRKNHQCIDNRIGRFGSNDSRLGKPEIAAADTLFGVTDGGSFHRPLHGSRTAAGTDVEAAQAELVADQLGVVILVARNRMTAPAHHHVGVVHRLQDPGVTQDVKDRIGHSFRGALVEFRVMANLVTQIDDIAQYGEQMFPDAGNHFPVDKRTGRRTVDVELDAPLATEQPEPERLITLQQFLAVIELIAAIEHCQRAIAEQLVQTAMAAIKQAGDFGAGQNFELAGGRNLSIDDFVGHFLANRLNGGANDSRTEATRESTATRLFINTV